MDGAKGLITVRLHTPPEHEEEFNDWYDLEHVPQLTALRGFVRTRHYHCAESDIRYLAWYETTDGFNADHDVTGGFGLNVFYRSGEKIYRTYFTTDRGVETLGTIWTLLDLTPLGRQETWEKSPPNSLSR